MTEVLVKTVRRNCNLDRVEQLAPNFAAHLAATLESYYANINCWKWAPGTVTKAFLALGSSFADVMGELQTSHQDALVLDGMDALKSESLWAHVEAAIFHRYGFSGRHAFRIRNALLMFNSIYQNQPELIPPSECMLRGRRAVTLFNLYKASANFMLDYKRLLLEIDRECEAQFASLGLKESTYFLLSRLLDDEDAWRVISLEGFGAFANHPELLRKINKIRTFQSHLCMYNLLVAHDPARWGGKTVTVFGQVIDLTELFLVSELLYRDLKKYIEIIAATPLNGRIALAVFKSLNSQIKNQCILRVLRKLPGRDADAVKTKGYIAFADDEYRILKKVHSLKCNYCWTIKKVIDTLFPDKKKDWEQITSYKLAFPHQFSKRPTYCDFGPVRKISVTLYDDFVALLQDQLAHLDEKPYNETSLHTRFSNIRTILLLFRKQLVGDLLSMLQKHGLKAFNLPKYRLQKSIFLFLQNAARTGSLATATAKNYRHTVIWLIQQLDFRLMNTHPIGFSKTEQHLKRLNTDDYYSAEQCREIAFHVECLLLDPAITGERRLSLMLARILLKTGWNLTPTLGIECNDIIQTATPRNPNGKITILIQKPRASYATHKYTFDPVQRSTMRSAVADLLYVRDELTATLRAQLPDSNPYKSFVFLVERKGEVQRLSKIAARTVTDMLKKRECSLTFNTKKIRKGGMNHLYRTLHKDLAVYEAAAKHTPKVFETEYLRIDENQARYKLGKGITIMGDYFLGKDVSEKIIIVTEAKKDYQHVPSGECVSRGNDVNADFYNKEHKRLHSEQGVAASFCADFLGCVWCKFFRMVSDPEHVWKLLSYKEYVLYTMKASAIVGDVINNQQKCINILKERVDAILGRLDKVKPGVVEKGQALLRDRSLHPDWAYVMPDAPISKDSSRRVICR